MREVADDLRDWKQYVELIRDLKKAGFVDRGGKGSHRNFTHAKGTKITLSGSLSHAAKRYQERDVENAVRKVTE